MNILFLCHRIPYPLDKGEKIRAFNLLSHLAKDHTVHLGAFVDDPADVRHVPTVRDMVGGRCLIVPLRRPVALARMASALIGGAPLKVVPAVQKWTVTPFSDRGAAQVAADRVREVMWLDAGIARTAKKLRAAVKDLAEIEERLPPGHAEEPNLVQTARLIVEAALRRKESRGGHYRSDFPRARRNWRWRHIEL